jgi:hypothetical protein
MTDDFRKHQMITEFQEELTKIYSDFAAANDVISKQKRDEYQTYQDIMSGIIIL